MSVHNPAFTTEEYRTRLAKVQTAMAFKEIDAFLIHNRADICYLTGMENCYMVAHYAVIIPASGDPILLASEFEMFNAEVGVWTDDRVRFPVGADAIRATCHTLKERGYSRGRIGVQMPILSAEHYLALQRYLPDAILIDAGDLMFEITVIKSAAEIACLREAARQSTLGMEAALAAIDAGKTDNEVAAAASDLMLRSGSEFMCIDPIVTVGERAGIPHSTFRRTVIQPGDSLFLEVGGCFCRYSAPLMRTGAVSPVPATVRRAADACRASLNVLIEEMRPGALASDIAAKAKAAWMPLCEELVWHGIYAYTVGLGFPPEWNDGPALITEDSPLVLQPGMCFHTTTSLREPLQYGAAMSEAVLITETGNEVLTGTARELFVA